MSVSPTEQLLQRVRAWADHAVAARWLQERDLAPLAAIDLRSPDSLFEAGQQRPLVVAFFGGSGVGKSSLLNRLAGDSIARTGVERPTSREVTLYLHDSIEIARLPEQLPLESIQIARHDQASARSILWIDTPDFDSVEERNRDLVLTWLPHIDLLIYVVSPERYRDEKGWRLLRDHGGEHAWLFVMNQWDRGHPLQYEAFTSLLQSAGFDDPVVLRTDCSPSGDRADEFHQMPSLIEELSHRHTMRHLEQRAEKAHRTALREALSEMIGQLGPETGYLALDTLWESDWEQTRHELMTGLEWPIRAVAAAFTSKTANPLARAINQEPRSVAREEGEPAVRSMLWDEWANGRLRDSLDRLIVEAGQKGLPIQPLKASLERVMETAGKEIIAKGEWSLRRALANPGSAVQRFMLKLSGGLAVLLPLGALGWMSYRVVLAYYESAEKNFGYLGGDFAIHSLLLLALSWGLPYFSYHRLRPSIEKAALKGLKTGISHALDSLEQQVNDRLLEVEQERKRVQEEGERLKRLTLSTAPAHPDTPSTLLGRLLPDPQSPAPS